jgi:N-hydroxyarylamine O-acetyltransferase
MAEEANLNAYFERIGFAGSIAPTLQTLQALHAAHPAAIAFENLDPLMDVRVRLDARAIEQKLIHERRGGYCFEHNMLFLRVLRTLGFEVRSLSARVLWGREPDAITPETHMLLAVDIGGSTYVADVGFGAATLTAPLRLRAGAEQETPHEAFRFVGEDPVYRLEMQTGPEEWRPVYRFGLGERYDVDHGVANWFVSTHPDSSFRAGLMAARAEKGRRLSLQNRELTIRPVGGEAEKRELGSVAEVREALTGLFGIVLPAAERLDPVLARVLGLEGP